MNTRYYMVIIKGEIKTSEIMSCGYNRNTQKWDVKFNTGKIYSYAYLNVEKLTDPEVLNPNMYRISREGREFFDVKAIYVFRSRYESYWHICFGNGSERDYHRSELNIVESCLTQSQSSNVFEYIKQIAGLSNIRNEETGEKLLSKRFDKISFVGSDVALAKYLNPSSLQGKRIGREYIPIFPFGCKEPYDVMAEYPVILSTTFSSRNSLNSDVVYDYLIMDEASQVDIATGALALSCARNVVIVGDTKQLPNVVTDDIKAKAKAIFDSFNVSEGYQYTNSFLQSILDVMPNVTQTLLREHYRCHPKIINFCNQKFYRGELIIMTTDKGEEDVLSGRLSVVKTVAGNHERNHYSQRQIDVIKNEIIPKYVSNPEETGIIAPYKNQVEALSKEITDIDAATVHKFQGKEKENIIISTVDDEISDFADDPYLINVAVSRAKKKLMLVVTGNEQSKERNITDLIDYIQYNNFEVTESKIYSIFDYLYKQYTEERRVYLQKHKKVSEYDSENLMYSLIEDIISANKYSSLDVVCHFPLNMLIKNPELLNEKECQYAMNPATHLDFLIYNRIGKKPVLAIEVDGYEYHKEDTVQASRDLLKNHIMELYEIPLLRFMTNGSGEREKIVEMLDKSVG